MEEKYSKFLVNSKSKKTDFYFSIRLREGKNFDIKYEQGFKKCIIFTPTSLRRFFSFNFFFKTAVSACFLTKNGFLLHASALKRGNYAYIFAGKQRSGKSTVIKLATDDYFPLNDDFALIRKIGNNYYIFSSPFYETKEVPKIRTRASIKKVLFLKKSGKNRLQDLTKSEVATKVASLILTPISLTSLAKDNANYFLKKIWQASYSFAKGNSFSVLYFKPDRSFFKLL